MGNSFSGEAQQVFHTIYKYCYTLYSGRCEIARICSGEVQKATSLGPRHTVAMNMQVARSIKHSKRLKLYSVPLFALQPFSVTPVRDGIVKVKQLHQDSSRLLLPNLAQCLQSLRLVNLVFQRLESIRQSSFRYDLQEHVLQLESLWWKMYPDLPRSGQRLSDEWGDLGFQGKDPASDFRGMGMLGLLQLVYFTSKRTELAKLTLTEANDPYAVYFPFAITGINITAFVLELYREHRLHGYLFAREDRLMLQDATGSPEGLSEDPDCLDTAVDLIHSLYCDIFLQFRELWKEARPRDLMEFPRVFGILKNRLRERFPAI